MHTIYTIGHSTRELKDFIELLKAQQISRLVDVRTIPKSLRNPQYGQAALAQGLAAAGIEYTYLKALGGLRGPVKDSQNTAWRNKSFRNYADYMQTDEFKKGLDTLLQLSEQSVVAIMCAEAVPWRCHRSLIGDALIIRGVAVHDIISRTNVKPHALTSFAVVSGAHITYPGNDAAQGSNEGQR